MIYELFIWDSFINRPEKLSMNVTTSVCISATLCMCSGYKNDIQTRHINRKRVIENYVKPYKYNQGRN